MTIGRRVLLPLACLISLSIAVPQPGQAAVTADKQVPNPEWKAVTAAVDETILSVGNTGACHWDRTPVLRAAPLPYTQLTATHEKRGDALHIEFTGKTAQMDVRQSVLLDGVKRICEVSYTFTARRRAKLPQFDLLVTGFNTNPRFDTRQGGQAVTGKLMDLPPEGTLEFEEYFEAGPIKTNASERGLPRVIHLVEVSDNLRLKATGMPMDSWGYKSTRIWAEPKTGPVLSAVTVPHITA